MDELKRLLRNAETRVRNIEARKEHYKQRTLRLEQENEKFQADILRLFAENTGKDTELIKRQEQIYDLTKHVKELQEQFEEQTQELKERKTGLEARIAELVIIQNDTQKKYQEASKELNTSIHAFDSLKEQMALLEKQKQQLNQQLAEANQQLTKINYQNEKLTCQKGKVDARLRESRGVKKNLTDALSLSLSLFQSELNELEQVGERMLKDYFQKENKLSQITEQLKQERVIAKSFYKFQKNQFQRQNQTDRDNFLSVLRNKQNSITQLQADLNNQLRAVNSELIETEETVEIRTKNIIKLAQSLKT